ncbi:MAG TPA: hypothetical protein VEK57_03065 [Thermoanaerobaculia bacterium]|nr:hypothetical protein [Thermoanaerobaculia bacterium]
MATRTYSIFGAGAAGLYTAWRLLEGKQKTKKGMLEQPGKGDILELYDWGKYDFSKAHPGTRAPGARVCTWHHKNDKTQSYVELGGMRYSKWDGSAKKANGGRAAGHRVVTTVISLLGLDKYSVPFNESGNPLFYLRTKNLYLDSITSSNPAPYHVDNYGADTSPDTAFGTIEQLAVNEDLTRTQWNDFYQHGRITADLPDSSVFQKGDLLRDVGYWNLMYDQLGGEGFNYAADGNGYTSNVINWNSADAFESNDEFTPGTQYSTLTIGYSGMFTALFDEIVKLARKKGVDFRYYPDTRLHSIIGKDNIVHFTYATRENPWKSAGSRTADAAWLAMPRASIDLVAQATRFVEPGGVDVLNHEKVQLYLEAAIMQPSYKVGMFFKEEWWLDPTIANPAAYPAPITGYVVTPDVILQLKKESFPAKYVAALGPMAKKEKAYESDAAFIAAVEQQLGERLTLKQEQAVLAAAKRNSIGPSITDTPIRMVVYFGNNAQDQKAKPAVYGILASYDDMTYTTFWRELELGPEQTRKVPTADDLQTLKGPREVPKRMIKMLRKQLAELHYGPSSNYTDVPEPIEAAYMDWSLPPFNAGYHAWAAHYDIAHVQESIRKPSQLIEGADANIFIVGETYSNDQAWVEGAYCTAESVLNDFFGLEPIIDDKDYPFICKVTK